MLQGQIGWAIIKADVAPSMEKRLYFLWPPIEDHDSMKLINRRRLVSDSLQTNGRSKPQDESYWKWSKLWSIKTVNLIWFNFVNAGFHYSFLVCKKRVPSHYSRCSKKKAELCNKLYYIFDCRCNWSCKCSHFSWTPNFPSFKCERK